MPAKIVYRLHRLKQAVVGLAAAVLIDATVIRSVLLPAAMAVLGERYWYLPPWLAWLPRAVSPGHAGSASGQRRRRAASVAQ